MTALALAAPGSGAHVTVQNACAAAVRESVLYQLLPSGVFKPLTTALQQLTGPQQQQQQQQQQQVAGDLITTIQGMIGTFADMLVVKCQYSGSSREIYKMTGAQVGVAAVEAAGLCTAVMQHPERLSWQDDSGMGEFVYVTEETLSKLVHFLHAASESVLTLYTINI